ncbi:MAG: hypothetical protein ACI4BH_01320 [Muribaculaceae bacterium]
MEKSMNNTTTRIHNLIILDRSGSMYSIREAAVSHLNECLQTIKSAQKEFSGQKHSVTIVTFNHSPKHLYINSDPELVNEITLNDYNPEGMTALYDAIGTSVTELKKVVHQGDKVLVSIITDGYENSSREYSLQAVKSIIEETKAQGWTYTFMAANIDEHAVAADLSINNVDNFKAERTAFLSKSAQWSKLRQRFYEDCDKGTDSNDNFFD